MYNPVLEVEWEAQHNPQDARLSSRAHATSFRQGTPRIRACWLMGVPAAYFVQECSIQLQGSLLQALTWYTQCLQIDGVPAASSVEECRSQLLGEIRTSVVLKVRRFGVAVEEVEVVHLMREVCFPASMLE